MQCIRNAVIEAKVHFVVIFCKHSVVCIFMTVLVFHALSSVQKATPFLSLHIVFFYTTQGKVHVYGACAEKIFVVLFAVSFVEIKSAIRP